MTIFFTGNTATSHGRDGNRMIKGKISNGKPCELCSAWIKSRKEHFICSECRDRTKLLNSLWPSSGDFDPLGSDCSADKSSPSFVQKFRRKLQSLGQ